MTTTTPQITALDKLLLAEAYGEKAVDAAKNASEHAAWYARLAFSWAMRFATHDDSYARNWTPQERAIVSKEGV